MVPVLLLHFMLWVLVLVLYVVLWMLVLVLDLVLRMLVLGYCYCLYYWNCQYCCASNSAGAIFLFFLFFLFVFGCFESRSGYKDRPIGRFSPSPSVVWRSVLWPGDWRILLLCIYIPAPFTESFDRLGRRMIFKESNSSYTARGDPFPSALSTRPSLLLFAPNQCQS